MSQIGPYRLTIRLSVRLSVKLSDASVNQMQSHLLHTNTAVETLSRDEYPWIAHSVRLSDTFACQAKPHLLHTDTAAETLSRNEYPRILTSGIPALPRQMPPGPCHYVTLRLDAHAASSCAPAIRPTLNRKAVNRKAVTQTLPGLCHCVMLRLDANAASIVLCGSHSTYIQSQELLRRAVNQMTFGAMYCFAPSQFGCIS